MARSIFRRIISRSTTSGASHPALPIATRHLKDGDDLVRDIDAGTLPAVTFYKPVGVLNQHPAYTDLLSGDAHIADLLERLRRAPQWSRMLVIVTYDENGGFWDHVPPPTGPAGAIDGGPATRIPAFIVSPFAKTRLRRQDRLRYDIDPEVDHPALRPRAAAGRAAERRRSLCRLDLP